MNTAEQRAQWCEMQAWKWRRKGMHDLAEEYTKTARWHREGTMECIGQLSIGQGQPPAADPTEETRALEGVWLAFTLNTSEEAARRRFVAKYGYEPAMMQHRLGLLLVGLVGASQYPLRG